MRVNCYIKFLLFVIIAFHVSCKKDNINSPVNTSASIPANAPISGSFYLSKDANSDEYFQTPAVNYGVDLIFFNPAVDLTSTIIPVYSDVGDVYLNGNLLNKHSFFGNYFHYSGVNGNPYKILDLPLTIQNYGSQNNTSFFGSFPCNEFTNVSNFDQLPPSYTLSAGFNYTLAGTNIPSSYEFHISGFNQDTLSIDTILSGNVISLPAQLLISRLDTGYHVVSFSFNNGVKNYISQSKIYLLNYNTRYAQHLVKFY